MKKKWRSQKGNLTPSQIRRTRKKSEKPKQHRKESLIKVLRESKGQKMDKKFSSQTMEDRLRRGCKLSSKEAIIRGLKRSKELLDFETRNLKNTKWHLSESKLGREPCKKKTRERVGKLFDREKNPQDLRFSRKEFSNVYDLLSRQPLIIGDAIRGYKGKYITNDARMNYKKMALHSEIHPHSDTFGSMNNNSFTYYREEQKPINNSVKAGKGQAEKNVIEVPQNSKHLSFLRSKSSSRRNSSHNSIRSICNIRFLGGH